MTSIAEQFGRSVRIEMAKQNLNTVTLAKQAGMPQKTVWTISRAKHVPTIEQAVKVSEGLGVPIEKLLRGEV